MGLSNDLISQFAKITNDKTKNKKESTAYGTSKVVDGTAYVKLDGSDLLTPCSSTSDVKDGDRVQVIIKNHVATVTGNLSSPAARTGDVKELAGQVTEVNTLVAKKVDTEVLEAEKARIDKLVSDNVTITGKLTANEGYISELQTEMLEVNNTLTAKTAEIETLKADKADVDDLTAITASISELEVNKASITDLEATNAEISSLQAEDAKITELIAGKLSVTDADLKYANIDFTNIGKAAMEYFYTNSGLIKNVTVGDQTITGNLVGVTISGDLIEGNTIVAEKLVIKGEDGLYYKLNTDGMTIEAEQTDYNSINGTVIKAKSITAAKISVDDLVAFDATIGGFKITENSIYSGVKETVDNTTRGIYFNNDGEIAFGDGSNFIKYYKDSNGDYKLEIAAKSVTIGTSNKSVEESFEELKNEISTLLRIESSRGTVFKNDNVNTVLSVVIYHGSQRITDSTTMKSVFGSSAYLQWKWQGLNDSTFGTISLDDTRLSNDGFTFTLSPEDVDTKVTFMCELTS